MKSALTAPLSHALSGVDCVGIWQQKRQTDKNQFICRQSQWLLFKEKISKHWKCIGWQSLLYLRNLRDFEWKRREHLSQNPTWKSVGIMTKICTKRETKWNAFFKPWIIIVELKLVTINWTVIFWVSFIFIRYFVG